MYQRFKWTSVSRRRNVLTAEYEPVQPYFLVALAERASCRTFVDVGSSIGTYSIFASHIRAVSRIVAYEANAKAAAEARRNFALNGLSIILREAAVSEAPGTVRFGLVSRFAGNNAVVETSIHDRSIFRKEVEVAAVTLDADCAGVSGPLCLKIDVEGHEDAVIRGAGGLLAENRAVIQVEDYRGATGELLAGMGYFMLTRIGPDSYFSNIADFRDPSTVIGVYEAAADALIAANHENKSVIFQQGDLGLRISGRTYSLAKGVAQRLIGKWL